MGAAMNGDAKAAQPLGICLALIAERIKLSGMDEGRRQAGEFLGAQAATAATSDNSIPAGTYSSRSRFRVSLSRK